ncbi:MAG: molybdopterin-dependent oxidoreductase, partial [Ruaniaceae bacterium]|nr:molybdopterin-dependent oxidoreductase [Ruaniaceae bacterium]
YTYSPTRVRYPYARGVLMEMYREAKARLGDPVLAFKEISTDPVKRRRYQTARGKGGLVRISWKEAYEIAASSYVNTVKEYGPDRLVSFSPIPAMSMVSHAIGTRFTHLMGGAMTSFYDWYADLPVASPQMFGDQTDVPESGDWWDATYLMMWGSNVPLTRTPDAHWMAEVRYRGTKVITVSPDYADNVKFADEWLPAQAGTDAALAMAMGHVILKENFVDRTVEYFDDYVKTYTDLGMLVTLVEHPDGHGLTAGKFVTAADLAEHAHLTDPAFKTVMWDKATGRTAVPNGSMGFRYAEDGAGNWNLDLGDIKPALTLLDDAAAEGVEVALPCFEDPRGEGSIIRRGVPAKRVGDHLVTTVFDLMLAQYGVGRPGLPGTWAKDYDDVETPYTPAWQAEITSVPAEACIRTAREFAQNSEESEGRTMIIIGAGICHWFHADVTYRAITALLMLTGCIGKNGGGWAHYVGQEKCRPMTGWFNMANATDWQRPPRTMIGTAYWYMHTDQWRTDGFSADSVKSPLSTGKLDGLHTADALALSNRLGWMPFYPQFDRNPLDVADEAFAAVEAGQYETPQQYVAAKLKSGELKSAMEDIDAPENWPRTMILWRSNLFGSSAKGNEYFLKHLLGTHNNVMPNNHGADRRPEMVAWHEDAPEGKLDLLITADFRMTSSTLLSDIVLPAATWYEKYDLSSTDMHPYVHAFTPAIDPPWETKSDFTIFAELAEWISKLSAGRLDTRKDIVAVAMQHDTPGQIAQPGGKVKDWRTSDAPAIPGKNLPVLAIVERDYTAIADKLLSVGPLAEKLGFTVKNITYDVSHSVNKLAKLHGVFPSGPAAGRPAINTDERLAEAILYFSGTTNGELATQGFRDLEKKTGRDLVDLSLGSEEKQITFAQTQASPQPVI